MLLDCEAARVQVGGTTLGTAKRGQLKPLRQTLNCRLHTVLKANMLSHDSKPCTHLTCHRCISQAVPTSQLTILTLHMLPIPRQHICNYVVLPRHIVDFQIQFRQPLQPTCLASVEVGLNEDVDKRFMISVYVTYIAMQVVTPLHTPQIHTHQFTVCYMVPTFSGGELFTVERHRTSTLCKLSTHSDNRCISGNIKRLAEVRQRQDWRCSQL